MLHSPSVKFCRSGTVKSARSMSSTSGVDVGSCAVGRCRSAGLKGVSVRSSLISKKRETCGLRYSCRHGERPAPKAYDARIPSMPPFLFLLSHLLHVKHPKPVHQVFAVSVRQLRTIYQILYVIPADHIQSVHQDQQRQHQGADHLSYFATQGGCYAPRVPLEKISDWHRACLHDSALTESILDEVPSCEFEHVGKHCRSPECPEKIWQLHVLTISPGWLQEMCHHVVVSAQRQLLLSFNAAALAVANANRNFGWQTLELWEQIARLTRFQ